MSVFCFARRRISSRRDGLLRCGVGQWCLRHPRARVCQQHRSAPVAEPQPAFVGLEAIQGLTQETLHLDPRVNEFDEDERVNSTPDRR